MQFCDSHAHISSPELIGQADEIIQRAKMAGVDPIVNICTDQKTLEAGILLAKKHSGIINAGATTPHDVEKEGELFFPLFEAAARSGTIAAVGETGLEYFHRELDREVQKKWLKRYLRLASELKLPVIFHCREAFADLFAIADDEYPRGAPAILHCFTGSMEEAEGVWKRGWHLSLSGIVTYKKSEELRRVAKETPLEQLLIETDSPYLAPQSRRGKVNEPAYLVETAACVAAARGVTIEAIAKATRENAIRLFSL